MGTSNNISCLRALLAVAFTCLAAFVADAVMGIEIRSLIEAGSFAEAERLLRDRIPNATAPVTHQEAIQLQILRRTRYDFPYTEEQVLAQLGKSIPDVTGEDIARWREAGDLQFRAIDGERPVVRPSGLASSDTQHHGWLSQAYISRACRA